MDSVSFHHAHAEKITLVLETKIFGIHLLSIVMFFYLCQVNVFIEKAKRRNLLK